jgi:hypothetical protein
VERDAQSIYDAINKPSAFEIFERYFSTKVMEVLLARQLSQSPAVKGSSSGNEVVICSVDPGRCVSELGRDIPEEKLREKGSVPSLPTEEGAKNFVWVCLEDNIPPGSYISRCAIAP